MCSVSLVSSWTTISTGLLLVITTDLFNIPILSKVFAFGAAKSDDMFSSEHESNSLSWNDPHSMFSQLNVEKLRVLKTLEKPSIPTCGDQGSIIILRRLLIKLFRKFHSLEPNEIDEHSYDFSSYLTYQDYKSIDIFLNSSNCADLHNVENVMAKFIDDAYLTRPRIEFTWLENSPQLLEEALDMALIIVIFIMLYMRSRNSIYAAIVFSGFVLYYKDKYKEQNQEANMEHEKLVDFCTRPFYEKIFYYKYYRTNCDNIHYLHPTTRPLPNPIMMAIEYFFELVIKPFPLVMKNLGKGYEEFFSSFSLYTSIFGFFTVLFLMFLIYKLIDTTVNYLFNSNDVTSTRTSRKRRAPRRRKIERQPSVSAIDQ